jgi:UrcA family protein
MKIALPLGALALLATATVATAQADVMVTSDYLKMGWEQVSSQVRYGDLNLATDDGVEALRGRVKTEAAKMCGVPEAGTRAAANRNTCFDSVMASAEPQIVKLASSARAR